ncbi:hypothetical protein [Natrinema marinum]|uniref:hypothetical protein n=1 Tax=Natrinema marinum TaxID=2961598 RepID=UPI0020C8B168|nr:hypothetical protein [Natrinema marinum]
MNASETTADDTRQPYSRRRLLATGLTAGAVSIAGCAGDTSDSTDTGTDGSGDEGADENEDSNGGGCTPGHSDGDPACQQVADDASALTPFDAAGTALPITIDYPCGWQTSTTDQYDDRWQANATRDGFGSDGNAYVDVQIRCSYAAVTDGFLEETKSSGNYEEVSYEYDGETRTALVSAASTAAYGTTAHATVPFEDALVHVELVSTLKASSCEIEPRPDYDVVAAMMKTIAPNSETTFSFQ